VKAAQNKMYSSFRYAPANETEEGKARRLAAKKAYAAMGSEQEKKAFLLQYLADRKFSFVDVSLCKDFDLIDEKLA
jgi:hypothetical protein